MNRRKGWIKAAAVGLALLTVPMLALYFSVPKVYASGGWSPRFGTVAAKGLVMGDNGKPIWVEYDAEGKVVGDPIGEAHDALENAFVMPAAIFRAYADAFQSIKTEYTPHITVLYREQYATSAFRLADGTSISKPPLREDTWTVVVRKQEAMIDSSLPLVLHESPLDLHRVGLQLQDKVPSSARAVLLSEDRQIIHTSDVNIGYLAAFYTSKDGSDEISESRGQSSLSGYHKSKDHAWGPVAGAKVWTNLALTPVYTNENGDYGLTSYIPPCPGFYFAYTNPTYVMLRYRDFDPNRTSSTGSWYEWRDGYDFCFGYHEGFRPTTLAGLATQMSLKSMEAGLAATSALAYASNISIDVAMLTGQASMQNESRPGIEFDSNLAGTVPIGPSTEYAFAQPDFSTSRPFYLDLDEDSQPDKVALRKDEDGNILVDVWLGDAPRDAPAPPPDFDGDDLPETILFRINEKGQAFLDIWPDDADPYGDEAERSLHLRRQPDSKSDFSDQGLLKQISQADLENTDLYVYRVSNGQLITSRKGLRPNESNRYYGGGASSTSESFVNYRMLMRGPASFNITRTISFEDWASRSNVNQELQRRNADHLRVGEQVKVIMINRSTGYMGSAIGTFGENLGSGLISFSPEPIVMRPPNLKIETERAVDIEGGLTAGEQREYIIGFEGSGLTSDKVIAITTQWVDWDGSPLPEDLPGFTGRLAKVVEENVLGPVSGQIANFDIKPGKHIQLVQLPQEDIDSSHYYIHVSGEPMEGNPNFSGSVFDSTGAAGEGALQYRPDRYVPLQVPLYDEETTVAGQEALQAATDPGQPVSEAVKPVYKWVYRPEMQFSLFDLAVDEINRWDPDETAHDLLADDLPAVSGSDRTIDLLYTLLADELPVLEPFGPGRELVFAVGDEEALAVTGLLNTVEFVDLGYLALLEPEDFLSIRLYQNGDDENVLWEYDARVVTVEKIYVTDADAIPVAAGDSVTLKALTKPADRPVVWSILPWDDEVKANIDASSGIIYTEENSGSGYVKVRATDAEVAGAYKEALVFIGCQACAAASGGTCQLAGNAFCELAGIDARFSLGKAKGGLSAGDFFIRVDTPGPELSTPKSLIFSTLARETEERYDENRAIRQVLAPQTFVDIVANDKFSYDIKYYRPGDVAGEEDGLYVVAPSAEPFAVWRVENPDISGDDFTRLKISELKSGGNKVYEYRYDESQNGWSLDRGNGLQVETRSEAIDAETGDRIVTDVVKDGANNVGSKKQTLYHGFPWGDEIVAEVQDPQGAALTTVTTYYEDPALIGSYGKVKSRLNPDGSWVKYEYDSEGRRFLEARSWLDSNIDTPAAQARATYYDYTPVDPADIQDPKDREQPRTVTETIQGQMVGRTYYAYLTNGIGARIEIVERCLDPAAPYGDASSQRTVTTYYPDGTTTAESGRINSVLYPDGRFDVYTYEYGTYSPAANPAAPGSFTFGVGSDLRQTVTHGTAANPAGIAFKTTREISIQGAVGNELLRETLVYDGSTYARIDWTVQEHDEFGRVVSAYNSDGTRTDSSWGCCAKESETNAAGITTTYFYDDLQRVESQVREGLNAEIQTAYTYDAAGRQLTQTLSAGGLSLQTSNAYDTAGRLIRTTGTDQLVTVYDYDPSGLVTTVTLPGGATEITARYPDGRTKSITGSGVIPRFYEYGVNPDGTQWTTVYAGSVNSPRWEKTTVDLLGRTIRVEKPGFDGIETTENFYDEKGYLARAKTAGLADTINVYDDLGNLIQSGLDLDGSGSLEPASADRISETETAYALLDGIWWLQTRQAVYAVQNDGTATTTSVQQQRLTGLGSEGLTAQTVSIDIHGTQTIQQVFVDRAGATETREIDYPDSDTAAVSVMVKGLLVSATDKSGVAQTFSHDALGRRTGTTDPRTGTASTHYNDRGRMDYIEDPAGNRTLYAYDPATGRKSTETNALGKVTRYIYNDRGQVTHTWGDATYPVRYTYDAYGQMSRMHTYRSDLGWSGDTWPAAAADSSDITIWHYQESTGLLTAKEDAAGQQVTYTYTDGGKLDTRTWARTVGDDPLVTTYSYDPATAELVDIDYSDDTPDVTFAYDRLGRQQTISDAVGTRSFAYNEALQLESETITGLYDQVITRNYEAGAVKGRAAGFNLESDYNVTYGYDTTGRFNSVAWNVAGASDIANYSFVENSNLLKQLATFNGLQTTYSYESNRNLRTQIKNEYGANLISQYDYQYDALGRRTTVANSGQAFAAAAFNRFGYDDRNQLTESSRYQGSDVNDLSSPVQPEYRSYAYDPIGNRINATGWDDDVSGSKVGTYVSNSLNQYAQITTNNPQPTTDSFTYDFDGNLTEIDNGNGTVRYRYNAENRLIAVEPENPVEGDVKLEYTYDYIGRRVKKTVYIYESDLWSLTSDIFLLYDGWNLVKEITADTGQPATDKYYVWGLDLSQSLQGAGGIGGLLATVEGSLTYYFYYDGNGNVGQLVNQSDGSISAHYEYDPFGNSIVSNGPEAENNPYQFSTKYYDGESELYYYGYRYYSPRFGRWLSRDPMGEYSGIHLYLFNNNNSINYYDLFGLEALPQPTPLVEPVPTLPNRPPLRVIPGGKPTAPVPKSVPRVTWQIILIALIIHILAPDAGTADHTDMYGPDAPIVDEFPNLSQPRFKEQVEIELQILKSKKNDDDDDNKKHRGRIQAQGNNVNKSVGWAKDCPLTLLEGRAKLYVLSFYLLTDFERQQRLSGIISASKWMTQAAPTGVQAYVQKPFLEINYTKKPNAIEDPTHTRIDIEVTRGLAFVLK